MGITISNYPAGLNWWSDVYGQSGTPISVGPNRVWHCSESNFVWLADPSLLTYYICASSTNTSGFVKSLMMFTLCTNADTYYMEKRPVFQCDNNDQFLANGMEDTFHGSFYFQEGQQHFAGPEYGASAWGTMGKWLRLNYGWTYGSTCYEFYDQQWPWTNSFKYMWGNGTANGPPNTYTTNVIALTWTTAQ